MTTTVLSMEEWLFWELWKILEFRNLKKQGSLTELHAKNG